MGRKFGVILLTTALVISALNPAQAAIKAGAACTKSGQSISQSGTTYKCLKVGKKLVWQKSNSGASAAKANFKELDACAGLQDLVIGRAGNGLLVYLSCGPDGKLHPQNGAPEIDQATGKPIRSRLGLDIMDTDYVKPPTISAKPASTISDLGVDLASCKIADAGVAGERPSGHCGAVQPAAEP